MLNILGGNPGPTTCMLVSIVEVMETDFATELMIFGSLSCHVLLKSALDVVSFFSRL